MIPCVECMVKKDEKEFVFAQHTGDETTEYGVCYECFNSVQEDKVVSVH